MGPYTLGRALGRGTFGRVVQGERDGTLYALKFIAPQGFHNEAEAWDRECQTFRALSHPNILRFFECLEPSETRPEMVLVCEYCETDLRSFMAKR